MVHVDTAFRRELAETRKDKQTSSQGKDDHNTAEDVIATLKWKHNYEVLVLAQQIDQISPGKLNLNRISFM